MRAQQREKVEMLAWLIHAGSKDSELLKIQNVRREDIEAAKDLLRRLFSGESALRLSRETLPRAIISLSPFSLGKRCRGNH